MPPGVIIPMESTSQGQSAALANARERLASLGQRIHAIIEQYNTLRPQVADKPQLLALLEQRRAAVEAVIAANKARLDALQAATGQAVPGFKGLGATDDLSALEGTLTTEQNKLTALSTYFEAYKAALAAGTQPPALPAELSEGTFGISPLWLAGLAALAAGAYFLWFREK